MTRQRGIGVYQRTARQEHDVISWMTIEHLDRGIDSLKKELDDDHDPGRRLADTTAPQ